MQHGHDRDNGVDNVTIEQHDDIKYGLRCPRNRTTYFCRDSSAINPAQAMISKSFHTSTMFSRFFAKNIMHSIIWLLPLVLILGRLKNHLASACRLLAKTKSVICKLQLLVQITLSYSEIAFLHAEDLSVFCRRDSVQF